jgi:hypothetical protein
MKGVLREGGEGVTGQLPVKVALGRSEVRVPGERTHAFEICAAARESRAEVVAQGVRPPLFQA